MSLVAFTAGSLGDVLAVSQIIFNVIRALNESSSVSPAETDLMAKLHSLQFTLEAAGDLLRLNETSTGRSTSLPTTVHTELVECQRDLDQFLKTLQESRQPLRDTSISSLWKRVWWVTNSAEEVRQMIATVERHKTHLTLLFGIHNTSYTQQVLEQVRKPWSNHSSIERIHIPLLYIQDPVGVTFPVAISHVFSWPQLHEVILAYTKDRCGHRHVRRNAYDLFDEDNNNMMEMRTSPAHVKDGTHWDMSMIEINVRSVKSELAVCPKCKYDNAAFSTSNTMWITCAKCSGLFCISEQEWELGEGQIVSPNVTQPNPDSNDVPDDVKYFKRIRQVLLTTRMSPRTGHSWATWRPDPPSPAPHPVASWATWKPDPYLAPSSVSWTPGPSMDAYGRIGDNQGPSSATGQPDPPSTNSHPVASWATWKPDPYLAPSSVSWAPGPSMDAYGRFGDNQGPSSAIGLPDPPSSDSHPVASWATWRPDPYLAPSSASWTPDPSMDAHSRIEDNQGPPSATWEPYVPGTTPHPVASWTVWSHDPEINRSWG